MPDDLNRTTEEELASGVLFYLAGVPKGEASFAEIIEHLSEQFPLTEEDRARSQTRPAEEIWEQRVRNITSHKNSEGNYIYEGYLREVPGGLSITEAGRVKAGKDQS